MKFTPENITVLEKNRSYYDNLKQTGTLTRCSSVIVGEFAKVYNDATGKRASLWCSACIIELIENLYINYYKYLSDERQVKQTARPEQAGEQSKIPGVKSVGKNVQKRGGITGKN